MKVKFNHSEVQKAVALFAANLTTLTYKPESCVFLQTWNSVTCENEVEATIELAEAPKEEAAT